MWNKELDEIFEYYFDMFPDFDRIKTPVFKAIARTEFEMLWEVMDTLEKIEDSRNIDKAFGYTLDLMATDIGLKRPPGMNDDAFRDLIKMQVVANKSGADIETLNKIGRYMFGENYKGVREAWRDDYPDDLAGIKLRINARANQDPRLMQQARAAGVKMFYNYYGPTANSMLWVGSHSYLGMTTTVYPEVIDFTELNKVKEKIDKMSLFWYTPESIQLLESQLSLPENDQAAVDDKVERLNIALRLLVKRELWSVETLRWNELRRERWERIKKLTWKEIK